LVSDESDGELSELHRPNASGLRSVPTPTDSRPEQEESAPEESVRDVIPSNTGVPPVAGDEPTPLPDGASVTAVSDESNGEIPIPTDSRRAQEATTFEESIIDEMPTDIKAHPFARWNFSCPCFKGI
jgi:hypothetical protein